MMIFTNYLSQVENASTKEDLSTILVNLRDESAQLSVDFSSLHESGNFEAARTFLIKMKYLASIEKSIKEKLLTVNSS